MSIGKITATRKMKQLQQENHRLNKIIQANPELRDMDKLVKDQTFNYLVVIVSSLEAQNRTLLKITKIRKSF